MYTIIIIQLYPKPDSRPVLVLWKPRIAPGSESKTPGSVKSICGSRFAWEPVAMTTAVLQSSVAVPSGLLSCTRFWSTKDADPCRTSTWKTRSIRMVFWLALKVILDDFQSKKGMGNWSVCPSFTTHNFPLQHITSYYIIKKRLSRSQKWCLRIWCQGSAGPFHGSQARSTFCSSQLPGGCEKGMLLDAELPTGFELGMGQNPGT